MHFCEVFLCLAHAYGKARSLTTDINHISFQIDKDIFLTRLLF